MFPNLSKTCKSLSLRLAVLRGDYSIFILKFKYALKDPDSNAKLYKWDLKFKFGYIELYLAHSKSFPFIPLTQI